MGVLEKLVELGDHLLERELDRELRELKDNLADQFVRAQIHQSVHNVLFAFRAIVASSSSLDQDCCQENLILTPIVVEEFLKQE